jgi:DNA repair exonuclease SbcCD ATPase subunit
MRNHCEVKILFGVLLAALSVPPSVLAQSQSQSQPQAPAQSSSQAATPSKTQGQNDTVSASSSASTNAKTQNASSNEPKMESQEAPPAESLGEAARKARAQKAAAAAPAAKVYTDDKVARLSGRGVSVVGDGNQSGESSDAETPDDEPNTGGAPKGNAASSNSEEKMWREKARAIHDQMAQIDDRISKIQEEIQKYGAVSIDPASGLRQNIIYVEDRNAQIKQLEEQKAKLQSQLESLEEEGRKAGADSGWFR